MGIKMLTKKYLAAEKAYKSLYKVLEYHTPAGSCLADWRSSSEYKKMLKQLGEPILREKSQCKNMLSNIVKN